MRFFTDNSGNFNWAAIGAICAVIGSALAVATFFMSGSKAGASAENLNTVLGDFVAGDKIEGITLEQYEAGLLRREKEVIESLEDESNTTEDTELLRATLQRIDAQQTNLQQSYENVEKLTAQIRAYQNNVENKELVEQAVLDIFDGNIPGAAGKALDAGIPLASVGTIENTSRIFQPVRTEADFQKFVAGRELVLSDDVNYTVSFGRDGSINGYSFGTRSGSGTWAWINGQFCQEFSHRDTHYPQKCFPLFVSNTAVKFEYGPDNIDVYTK